MKDSLFLSSPPLTVASFCCICLTPRAPSPPAFASPSLLYILNPIVNANKAFSHTELMYLVHFTNVLPFKCHLLCRRCEYILATVH